MTKKDYLKLAKVFSRKNMIVFATPRMGLYKNQTQNNIYADAWMEAYHFLLGKLVKILKADNPRFDADKFMQILDE